MKLKFFRETPNRKWKVVLDSQYEIGDVIPGESISELVELLKNLIKVINTNLEIKP